MFLIEKTLAFAALFSCGVAMAQQNDSDAPEPFGVLPTERQLQWQETEMYCLIHFTPTTFQNKEWGYGDADPEMFNPAHFDAEQIVAAAKAGGFKGIISVAKHHDGFALWPTKTAAYNISESPWKNGKGDMVREFQEAAKKLGMKFGVYCSPWDRNNPAYGTEEYVNIYRQQLRELYSNYGDLFMSWHDGANGGDGYYGGKKEARKVDQSTYYDWHNTWAITRELQPGAAIFSDIGLDVRWVGNEKGIAPETSWSTITLAGKGDKEPMPGFMEDGNLGSGTRLGKQWIPTECDVPLRPGWFYHPEQDDQLKSVSELFDLYCRSVGRGGAFDLGLSPNTDGLLHENDVKVLESFGRLLKAVFENDLAESARFEASNIRNGNGAAFGTANLSDEDRYSYWATDDAVGQAELIIELEKEEALDLIRLRENIKLGQRVEKVTVSSWEEGTWKEVGKATSIGANRLIRLDKPVNTRKLRLQFEAPVALAISEVGLFKIPEDLLLEDEVTNATVRKSLPAENWTIRKSKSRAPFDNDPSTLWESKGNTITIDLGGATSFSAFGYLPRQDGAAKGMIQQYELDVSEDGKNWRKIQAGEFSNIKSNPVLQYIRLEEQVIARFVRLRSVRPVTEKDNSISLAEWKLFP